ERNRSKQEFKVLSSFLRRVDMAQRGRPRVSIEVLKRNGTYRPGKHADRVSTVRRAFPLASLEPVDLSSGRALTDAIRGRWQTDDGAAGMLLGLLEAAWDRWLALTAILSGPSGAVAALADPGVDHNRIRVV